jgi:hypothetical protein
MVTRECLILGFGTNRAYSQVRAAEKSSPIGCGTATALVPASDWQKETLFASNFRSQGEGILKCDEKL